MKWRLALLLVGSLVLAGCGKVNQENYSRLKAGQTKAEVEQILGASTECAGALGVTTCTWGDRGSFISVQYLNDKVAMFAGQGLR